MLEDKELTLEKAMKMADFDLRVDLSVHFRNGVRHLFWDYYHERWVVFSRKISNRALILTKDLEEALRVLLDPNDTLSNFGCCPLVDLIGLADSRPKIPLQQPKTAVQPGFAARSGHFRNGDPRIRTRKSAHNTI